jgi:hypothetical protein
MSYHKFFRYLLTLEAIALNGGTGLICLILPAVFIAQFSNTAATSLQLEFIRWYGVLLFVLAYLVLRILPMNDSRMLFPAVEALLFGDIVHFFAIILFYIAQPVWNTAFVIMLISTVSLAVFRSVWLFRYHTHKIPAA